MKNTRARFTQEHENRNSKIYIVIESFFCEKNTLDLTRQLRILLLKIEKRKRVNEHPLVTNEASDGTRPPRGTAADG